MCARDHRWYLRFEYVFAAWTSFTIFSFVWLTSPFYVLLCSHIVFPTHTHTQFWLARNETCAIHLNRHRELGIQRARKLEMKLKKFTIAFSMLRYLSMWKLVVHVCNSNVATTYFIVLVISWNYEHGKNERRERKKRQGNAQQKVIAFVRSESASSTNWSAHSTTTLP